MNGVSSSLRRMKHLRQALALPLALRRHWHRFRMGPSDRMLHRLGELSRSDVVLRIDEFEGVFSLPATSHLVHRILRYGSYEPELAELYRKHIKPNLDILDIGANVGFYTVLGATRLRAGRVFAAEPTAAANNRLLANVERNGVNARVLVHRGLISNVTAEQELATIPGMEEYSSMGGLVHPSVSLNPQLTIERVTASRLDDLVARHSLRPALMKVDVEGAEGLVFDGARETLREFRPVVISELSPPLLRNMGSDARSIVALFKDLNYRITDPFGRGEPGTAEYGDILCIPN